MRDNSGSGDSSNNLRDPTLKEHEAARGRSGQAPLDSDDKPDEERKGTTGATGGDG